MKELFKLKDADFSLVEVKNNHPHCKLHGAMNRMTKDGIYRCISTYRVEQPVHDPRSKWYENNCKAGCQEEEND